MDIFFQDPSEVPLPPEQVRILELSAEPYPDGRRVRVSLTTNPFLKRPNADVFIYNAAGEEVAQTSVIESMGRKMEMTLHLRHPQPGDYQLKATLFYRDPIPEPPPDAEPIVPELPEAHVVDQKQIGFHIE